MLALLALLGLIGSDGAALGDCHRVTIGFPSLEVVSGQLLMERGLVGSRFHFVTLCVVESDAVSGPISRQSCLGRKWVLCARNKTQTPPPSINPLKVNIYEACSAEGDLSDIEQKRVL